MNLINRDTTTFSSDGYVFGNLTETESGTYVQPPVTFVAGSPYSHDYEAKLKFTDAADNPVALEDYGFMHYSDGSIASFSQGVVMDLSTLESEGFTGYAVGKDTPLSKSGDGYTVSHLGSPLDFESIVWKLDENRYLFAGSDLVVTQGSEDIEVPGDFVEVSYIDSGVVQITSEDQTLLTVNPQIKLAVNDDINVDLVARVITAGEAELPMTNIVVDAADNIEVTPLDEEEEKIAGVTLPNFTVINGTDGESGAEGGDGTTGTPGTAGKAGVAGDVGGEGTGGLDGVDGATGAAGAPGIGQDSEDNGNDEEGGTGSDPVEIKPNLPNYELPSFTLSEDWKVTAYTASGTINMDNEGKTPLVDEPVLTLRHGDKIIVKTSIAQTPYTFNLADFQENLEPGQEYQMTLEGKYKNDSGVELNKVFFTKTFRADDLGLNVLPPTVATNQITINLQKENYSYANEVTVNIAAAANPAQILHTIPVTFQSGTTNYTAEFPGLTADTPYIVTLTNLIYQPTDDGSITIPAYGDPMQIKTLKDLSAASVGIPYFTVNRQGSTFGISPNGINPGLEMNAIQRYRYEFYNENQFEVENGKIKLVNGQPTLLPDQQPVKSVSTTSRSTQVVDVSVTAQLDPSNLTWGTRYRVRLVVEYNDNLNTRDIASAYTDTISLAGAHLPIVTWINSNPNYGDSHYPAYYDRVTGTIDIDLNGATLTNSSLTLKFESTERIDHVFEITVDPNNSTTLTGAGTISSDAQRVRIAVDKPGLNANNKYVISVWGTVDLHDPDHPGSKLISMGRMTIATIQPQSMAIYMAQAVQVEDGMDASKHFTVNTWATASFAGTGAVPAGVDPAVYEARNLAFVEYELHGGSSVDSPLLGTATVASADGTAGKPLESTLYQDDYSSYYKGRFTENKPAVPVRLTETDFGLDYNELDPDQYPVVTIVAKRAVDYTSGITDPAWKVDGKNIFENTFTIEDGSDHSSGLSQSQNLVLQIILTKQAPPPPTDGKNALTVNAITEGSANVYVPSYNVRPDVDPNTVVGYSIKADFLAPDMLKTVTYSLYRSKKHYTLVDDVNDPIQYIKTQQDTSPQGLSPGDDAGDELLDPNRTQVDLREGDSKETLTLPANVVGSGKVAPTLIIMFGDGQNILPASEGGSADHNGASTFYVFLDDEENMRGYSYYSTYTALLDLQHPTNPNLDYIYPQDYIAPDSTPWPTGAQLYSARMPARFQEPVFKRYPSLSDLATETWKFTLNDHDKVIPEEGGANNFKIKVKSDDYVGETLVTQREGDVVVARPADSTTWGSMVLRPSPDPLFPDEVYSASYQVKLWKYDANEASVPTLTERPFSERLHQEVIGELQMKQKAGQTDSQAAWTFSDNTAANTVSFTFPLLSNAINEVDYNRVVALKVHAEGDGNSNPKDIILPINKDSGNAGASLSYATLSSLGYNANSKVYFDVSLVYDTGARGLELPAGGDTYDAWAIQTVGISKLQPNTPGLYYVLGDVGTFLPRAAHSSASGQYYNKAETVFSQADMTLTYKSVPNILDGASHEGTLNLIIDANGVANSASSSEYVTLKGLDTVDLNHPAVHDFTMPYVVPEVRNQSVVRGQTEATLQFTIFGGATLETWDPGVSNYWLWNDGTNSYDHVTGASGSGQWIVLNLYKRTGDTNLELTDSGPPYDGSFPKPSSTSPIYLKWTPQLNMSEQTYQIPLTQLQTDTSYMFTIKGRVQGKTSVENPKGSPIDDNAPKTTQQYFFYDVATSQTGRQYQFSTQQGVSLGADPSPIKVTYRAVDYSHKYLDLSYPITAAGSYKVIYTFKDKTTNGTLQKTSALPVFTNPVNEAIPVDPASNATDGNFWKFDGRQYDVTLQIFTQGTNQMLYDGSSNISTFTLRRLNEARFVMTATPNPSDIGFKLRISPIDNDKVIVEGSGQENKTGGQYRVLLYNKDKAIVGDFGPYIFNSTEKVQEIQIPATQPLLAGDEYTIQVYGVQNMTNTVNDANNQPYYNIEALHSGDFSDSASAFQKSIIRAMTYTPMLTTLIDVGQVWTSTDTGNTIRVNFENALRLDLAAKVQYTIYSADATFTYASDSPIDTNFQVNTSVNPPLTYMTFVNPPITMNGLYYIEMDFYNDADNLVGSASATYRRS
jgi:hypothetical protein